MDLFEELLKSGGGNSPPLTNEDKLRDSIDTLSHKMESELNRLTTELTEVKSKIEKGNDYEKDNDQIDHDRKHGEAGKIQNDTKPADGDD